jgi:PPOX class probable F420-dependent enzyme
MPHCPPTPDVKVLEMPRQVATNDVVDREGLIAFMRPRHRVVLGTSRADGEIQLSPVTAGTDGVGRLVIASYPQRAKVVNLRRRPQATGCVLSDEWNGPWVQVAGHAEVLDLPEAMDPLVDYYRSISGEHPDWDGYRAAMQRQGKCLIRLTVEKWGPIATGGFPAQLSDS